MSRPPPLAVTLKDADYCGAGVTVCTTASGEDLYCVHGIIKRSGMQKPLEALDRWVRSEKRLVSQAAANQWFVTKAGLKTVLRTIWQPDAAQAQTDVQALADALDINLDAEAGGADRGDDDDADSGFDLPELADDEDDWGDEDDDADYQTESDSDSEAPGGRNRMDDRKPPRAPTLAATVHYSAAKDALRAASAEHLRKVQEDMQNLPEGTAIVHEIDNLFKRRRRVPLTCACCLRADANCMPRAARSHGVPVDEATYTDADHTSWGQQGRLTSAVGRARFGGRA